VLEDTGLEDTGPDQAGPDQAGLESPGPAGPVTAGGLRERVREFLAGHDLAALPRIEFLRARFDAGLAWVHYPPGLGGMGLPRALQPVVDAAFAAAGAPGNNPERIGIGLGMAAPTILGFGSDEQKNRWLRPLWTGEEVWCQLFSEPGAGSDLAGLATRAVRAPDGTASDGAASDGAAPDSAASGSTAQWEVTGQKVWTSSAHLARWGLLLARTDPDVPKHQGLTYFICDMTAPGVEVRPLRQLTGEAEFNEVFLSGVVIPDTDRIGGVGEGWRVAQGTLMNERVAIGGAAMPREGGMIGSAARTWREHPELRTPGLHDRMLRLWADAEVARLSGERLRQQLAAGQPGPEGSAAKLVFARLNQEISGFEVELAGADGLRYSDWSFRRPESVSFYGRDVGYRYLRAKGNSIEGGTSEILRNIIAERVLGLPPEPRVDTRVPWKDLPR
jgi:alkylation response protein AidB-like acyl-CoA dehydrogenase